jgi:Tol biopolymer transport system component
METRGDCAGALPHFDSAARSPEASTSARAILLRGMCEERLGRPDDARATYQRLIRTYPAEAPAADARTNLGRMRAPAASKPSTPLLRRLQVAEEDPSGSFSRNGRFYAFRPGGVPTRQDLRSGQTQSLTLGPGEDDWSTLVLSPDGQQVAYTWGNAAGKGELRVMTVPAGTPRTIRDAGDLQAIRPVAWSADARQILVITTDDTFRTGLELIDLPTLASTRLAELGHVEPFGVTMSGDARWVAFDHAPGPGPRDIRLLDVQTRQVTTVVGQPANDTMPVFLPGERSLVFGSDRLGPLSLWTVPIADGRAVGEPVLVRRDAGRVWPMAMTSDGTFIHAVQNGLVDVHVAGLDDDGGLDEQPAPVTATFAGANLSPDWSADGASLAYVADRGALSRGAGSRALVIRDRVSGAERVLYPDLLFFIQPRWAPDGSRILVKGRSAATNLWGLHMVDVRTAAVTSAVTAATTDAEGELGPVQWVPGREAILIGRHGKGIVEFDLVTQAERILVPLASDVVITAGTGCSYAPDGRSLAWSVREGRGPKAQHVLHVRDAGGTTRELLRTTGPEWLQMMDWAPDGRSLFVVRNGRQGAQAGHGELWRVPVDGNAPVPTGLSAFGLRGVSVHPDGKTIAYTAGFPTWEIWAMEGIK